MCLATSLVSELCTKDGDVEGRNRSAFPFRNVNVNVSKLMYSYYRSFLCLSLLHNELQVSVLKHSVL